MLSIAGRLSRNNRVGVVGRTISRRMLAPTLDDSWQAAGSFPIYHRHDDDDNDMSTKRLAALPHISRAAFHTSAVAEYRRTDALGPSGVSLAMAAGAVSAASFAGLQVARAVREWREAQPETPPEEQQQEQQQQQQESAKTNAQDETQKQQQQSQTKDGASDGPRENIFSKWFDVGGKYYEGGFEDTMTKREAALILGVRESSSAQRIKEAHRKLLILNHPDTGGSTFLSGKINEAKELLLKNKR